MQDDFEDKAEKWLDTILSVLFLPIRFFSWVCKLIWKVMTDVFGGVYKKLVSFVVVVIVVLIVAYIAKLTNQSWINNLKY